MELRPGADEWPSSGEDPWRKVPQVCGPAIAWMTVFGCRWAGLVSIDEQQQQTLWPGNGLSAAKGRVVVCKYQIEQDKTGRIELKETDWLSSEALGTNYQDV
ncbi:hypothetical protein PG993_000764 [Apiospora rasikravindrae]|uniref:Uncharacterized protein n=1 Tax=Apiospora rasikravindrae TaxID=990691 RepID=A0ABR1UA09_9PEZI